MTDNVLSTKFKYLHVILIVVIITIIIAIMTPDYTIYLSVKLNVTLYFISCTTLSYCRVIRNSIMVI